MSFKLNVFTGTFDLVNAAESPDDFNFSFKEISEGQTVTVPQGQQMLFSGPIKILGNLRVLGEIQDLSPQPEFYGWRVIPIDKVVMIPSNRQMLFTSGMRVLGSIRIQGDLKETGFL